MHDASPRRVSDASIDCSASVRTLSHARHASNVPPSNLFGFSTPGVSAFLFFFFSLSLSLTLLQYPPSFSFSRPIVSKPYVVWMRNLRCTPAQTRSAMSVSVNIATYCNVEKLVGEVASLGATSPLTRIPLHRDFSRLKPYDTLDNYNLQ